MLDTHNLLSTTYYLLLERFQKPGAGLTVQGRLHIPCASSINSIISQKGGKAHSYLAE